MCSINVVMNNLASIKYGNFLISSSLCNSQLFKNVLLYGLVRNLFRMREVIDK